MERRNKMGGHTTGGTKKFDIKNRLKLSLLEAIEQSSDDDFDILDVMYTVAKIYKDDYYTSKTPTEKNVTRTKEATGLNHDSETGHRKVRSAKYDTFDDKEESGQERILEENFVNIPNPNEDKFLGFIGIPTNQALAVRSYMCHVILPFLGPYNISINTMVQPYWMVML